MSRLLRRLRMRLRDLTGRARFEREMQEELDAFLDMSEAEHRGRGRSAPDARRRARIELGGVEPARDALRARRAGAWLDALRHDVAFALRRMRRQPGFTAVAAVTLALGMGASTAVVSVVRSVLLAPLPFRDSDRLVRLRVLSTDATGRERQLSLAPVLLEAIRERSRLVERAAGQRFQNLTLTGSGEPERIVATAVSDEWAETLGLRPVVGRTFSPTEQRDGDRARVAVIGYGLWQRKFGGSPTALGAVLRLDDRLYTVIGVMPRQFRYPYDAELWFPTTLAPGASEPTDLNAPARLRPGVTVEQLNDELGAITAQLRESIGLTAGARLVGVPMREEFARDPNRSVAALAVAVAFVLLLTCVNLATLLTARGAARGREMALRTALGAGRERLVRQLLTESVLLAGAGGAAGAAVAYGGRGWLAMLIPPRLSEVVQYVELDGVVLAVSAGVCVLTGVLFGLMPATRLARGRPSGALGHGERAGTGGRRALDLLVVGEMALATVLLIGAALVTQNVARLLGAGVGYDPDGLVRMQLGLSDARYDEPARRTDALQQILERVRHVPGVTAAGMTSLQPVPRTRTNMGTTLQLAAFEDPGRPYPVVNRRLVTPGYFDAVGVRLLAGRDFAAADQAGSEPVAVVNQAAARRFWPDGDPIGQPIRPLASTPGSPWHRVVGVVSDMAETEDGAMPETVYQPYAQASSTLPAGVWITTSAALMVRVASERSDVLANVRRVVWEIDPGMPIFDEAPMSRVLEEPLGDQRLGATVFAGFGLFGVLLAMLGTYGVLAFAVGERLREFGVRLALGARPSRLLVQVLASGARLLAAGLALGLLGALAVSRLLAGLLTEVNPTDPATFAAAAVALFMAALAACLPPALRAMRADPISVMKGD